jgi:hypothetical protein
MPGLFLAWGLVLLSAALTQALRYFTPGVRDKRTVPSPATNDEEATAIPVPDITSTGPTEGEEPPPYQLPITEAPNTAPKKIEKKRSPAESFLIGTLLFIGLFFCLFLAGLGIQAAVWCNAFGPLPIFVRLIFWIVYSIPCFWATVGASCWLILLRNLGGPRAMKRYPINENFVAVGALSMVLFPFVFFGSLLWKGAVGAVEACQHRICGDMWEDDETENNVELEEGRLSIGDDGVAEANEGEEERAGLMGGIKK